MKFNKNVLCIFKKIQFFEPYRGANLGRSRLVFVLNCSRNAAEILIFISNMIRLRKMMNRKLQLNWTSTAKKQHSRLTLGLLSFIHSSRVSLESILALWLKLFWASSNCPNSMCALPFHMRACAESGFTRRARLQSSTAAEGRDNLHSTLKLHNTIFFSP